MITVPRLHRLRGRHGQLGQWRSLTITRPESEDLATDPAMIRGCRTLAHRVLIQAFEDAAEGHREARAFLTVPSPDGFLAHWVAQGDFGVSLDQFVIGAHHVLDGKASALLTLFRRRGPTQRRETLL